MKFLSASLSILFAVPFFASAALIDDVTHSWPLDETSGVRVDEISSYDLTDNNTVGYTTGKSGNAALFEADNSEYFSYTANWLDYAGSDWSFSIWVRSDGNADNYRGIFSNRFGSYSTWLTLGANNGNGYLMLEDCGTHSVSLHDSTWHNIVVTHDDAATDVTKVYKDGVEVISCNYGGWGGTGNDMRLGLWFEGSQYWDGAMDEFYFFDTVLTATDAENLYADGDGFYYPFDEPAPPASPATTTVYLGEIMFSGLLDLVAWGITAFLFLGIAYMLIKPLLHPRI